MSAEGGAEPRPLDAGQLRKLSHDQHVVIQRLASTARTLVAEAGQGRGSWDRGTDRGGAAGDGTCGERGYGGPPGGGRTGGREGAGVGRGGGPDGQESQKLFLESVHLPDGILGGVGPHRGFSCRGPVQFGRT
ncbi:hypothetical protein Slala05_78260 [Streptomyces lavendulae subsp. lavendulae]|nr:hypothetical protein Slala05_78260 [Streptomyces lavendulae subsp. lavendulae]